MSLGGGNGFMFRTRRQKDAEAFAQEWQGRKHPRRTGRAGAAVVVGLVLVLLLLGLVDWLG